MANEAALAGDWLVLSNGAGEDAIGARLVHRLLPQARSVVAMPLVGAGDAYNGVCPIVGPQQHLPSQGLANESRALWWQDMRAGLFGQVGRQVSFLKAQRDRRIVAVGDVVPLLFCWLAGQRQIAFVGAAKSSWHHPYNALERGLMRRVARTVFARDAKTAADLVAHGVPAQYVGNVMMDELDVAGLLPPRGEGIGIAVFPGSREGAYAELPQQLRVLDTLATQSAQPVRAMVALADSLDLERVARSLPDDITPLIQWDDSALALNQGLLASFSTPNGLTVWLTRRALGDVLHQADVVLGQAGTANEQAAGLGLPVVAYESDLNLGWYRGRQKGLLGDAVEVVLKDDDAIVAALQRLLADPTERARRGAIGRERMGQAGGAARIAAALLAGS